MNSNGTAVVIGGTKGIGRAISEKYLAEGFSVVITARHPLSDPLGIPDRVTFFPMDASNSSDFSALAQHLQAQNVSIDVLINNVGVSEWRPLEGIDDEFLDGVQDTL